jgi:Tol biopolymer transport system component
MRANDFTLEGTPVRIAGPVAFDGLEHARFTVSGAGTLVYQPGEFVGGSEIERFDRTGRPLGAVGPAADFRGIRLSRDGRRIAMVTEDPLAMTPDIWIRDLTRAEATRFTFDAGTDNDPVWSPDATRIAFRSTRGERFGLYVRPAGGTEREQALLESSELANAHVHDWSRDGRFTLFSQVDASGATDRDLWVLPMQDDRTPHVLVSSANNQDRPRFSPNGRWVVYQTNETGGYRIYVVPFPATGGEWQVSAAIGSQPTWSADGKEIYYLSSDDQMMVVEVRESGRTIEFGAARPLFHVTAAPVPGWSYDVDPDGRFYILVPTDRVVPLTLVVNWLADAKP